MPMQIPVPFHGDPDLPRRAVDSVLAQTGPDRTATGIGTGTRDECPDRPVTGYFARPHDARVRHPHTIAANGDDRRWLAPAVHDRSVLFGADDVLPNHVANVRAAGRAHPAAAVIQPGVEVIDTDGRAVLAVLDRTELRVPRPRGGTGPTAPAPAGSLRRGDRLHFPASALRRQHSRQAADRVEVLSRRHAARTGRRHVLSRVHAATLLPAAVRAGQCTSAAMPTRHVPGRPGTA
jgi:hypothetical protein